MTSLRRSPAAALSDDSPLLLGIDIGGTKTTAALSEAARPCVPLAAGRSGSANVQNVSRDEALKSLAEAAEALDSAAPGWQSRLAGVCAGSGGLDTPEDAQHLEGMIREAFSLPSVPLTAVHDTRLILGAAAQRTGIALILGTGSVAWGRTDLGMEARAGGWGHLLGDEASAYWFGREALRGVLRNGEEGREDALTRAVLRRAGVTRPEELIAAFHEHPSRTLWAGFAPCVFDAADEGSLTAREIIAHAVELAAELVTSVADRLALEGPVVCGGGLVQNQERFARDLAERLAAEGIEPLIVLESEPVVGALFLAADASSERA